MLMRHIRVVIVGTFFTFFSACGGGGGGGGGAGPPPPPPPPAQMIVGGIVEAPNGQIAQHWPAPGIERWLNILVPGAVASVPGASPVPDGTPVDLLRLSNDGSVADTLANTTTSGGQYSFNFTDLGLDLANDLLITASGGAGIELRAFVTRENLDVDVESEATVRLALEQLVVLPGTTLSNFTLQELDDMLTSVRLAALVNGVIADIDVPTTVAAIIGAVNSEDNLSNFFSQAASQGQTSAGPGDIGRYFPLDDGASWTYDGSLTIDNVPGDDFRNSILIDGTRDVSGTLTTVFVETNSSDSGEPFESLLVKTDLGVSDWTEVPAGGPVLDLVSFPITTGATIEQGPFQISLGEDLDDDGIIETVTADVDSTVVGLEDLVVAGGAFQNTMRLDGTSSFSGTLSGLGDSFSGTALISEWFAPGIGRIRRDLDLDVTSSAGTGTATSHEELTGGVFLVTRDIRSNDTFGAVPAAGADQYFSLACHDQVAQQGIYATRVTGSGRSAGTSFIDETHYLTPCQNDMMAAAFDDSNFLVVFARTDNANNTAIVARRVRPDGQVLGSQDIVVSTGSSNFLPALAFDGTNYLVVWQKYDLSPPPPGEPGPGHEIYGARITPDGANLGEFPIVTAAGEQAFPSLAFDGTNYLVVWRDAGSGSGPSDDTNVMGARVSAAGVVLDDPPIAIVTAPRTQGEPQVASSGSNWLVVWNDIGQLGTSPPPDGRIFGRRVAPDGSVLDGSPDTDGIAIGTAPVANFGVSVAYVGNTYFAAWSVGSYPSFGTAGIYGARISTDGQLVGGSADVLGPSISGTPHDSSRFDRPRIVSRGPDGLLVWVHYGARLNSIDVLGDVIE